MHHGLLLWIYIIQVSQEIKYTFFLPVEVLALGTMDDVNREAVVARQRSRASRDQVAI